jgi:hypothetical protein
MEENQSLEIWAFEILEKVGNNTYIIQFLPPYMCIYLVVNVENMKLYEPSMLDEDEEGQVLFSLKFGTRCTTKLLEDIILQKKIKMTRRGQQELW